MNVGDFDYELPPELIAQRPLDDRDASRLMVVHKNEDRFEHRRFVDLIDLLLPGDLLVLNDTRVIPARLHGRKSTGGRVEVLLLAEHDSGQWRCLLNSSRKPALESRIEFGKGVHAWVVERHDEEWVLRFEVASGLLEQALDQVGRMPLPPYIRREPAEGTADLDRQRYQTVFARRPGAVAAPTAGLHFTNALLTRLRDVGVETSFLTLHVGPGTFLPVRHERVEDHAMHAETYDLPPDTAEAVARTRDRGGRVIAVGTTAARTLEHQGAADGQVAAGSGSTQLFIYPGYRFRVVDALITNFHLPRSTLLMLVSAFAGRDRVLAAYRSAVERGYRFYSYGDAMLLTA